jgi:hypothetical protein
MRRCARITLLSGLASGALVGGFAEFNAARAAEFHFVSQDLGENRAIWVPREVVIHRSTEMEDGLVFVLENPTNRTHAFAAYGLFEEIMGAHGETTTKPLRVNVTPEDSVRVQVSTAQFEIGQDSPEENFPFFCPLHKGEAHVGGTIHVVP